MSGVRYTRPVILMSNKRKERRQKDKELKKEAKKLYADYNKIAKEAGLNGLEKVIFIQNCIDKGVKPEDFNERANEEQ